MRYLGGSGYLIPVLAALIIVAVIFGIRGERPGTPGIGVPRSSPVRIDRIWQAAQNEVYADVEELNRQDRAEAERGEHLRKLMRGDPSRKWIALTFDDGPHMGYTPKLLTILKRYNVKATFFVVGVKAEEAPYLVLDEIRAGHSIGNHTYHHVNLTRIPAHLVAAEIYACGDVLKTITGRSTHLFRPPGGDYSEDVGEMANILGYTLILWTDDPGDYARPGGYTIETRTLGHVSNGAVILLHDGIQETIDVLPTIIETLKKRGYRFVTVDEMLNAGSNGRMGERGNGGSVGGV